MIGAAEPHLADELAAAQAGDVLLDLLVERRVQVSGRLFFADPVRRRHTFLVDHAVVAGERHRGSKRRSSRWWKKQASEALSTAFRPARTVARVRRASTSMSPGAAALSRLSRSLDHTFEDDYVDPDPGALARCTAVAARWKRGLALSRFAHDGGFGCGKQPAVAEPSSETFKSHHPSRRAVPAAPAAALWTCLRLAFQSASASELNELCWLVSRRCMTV